MPRRLPPLNALKAFEAAARHESFTRAAEELCVTQGAVSHQVKALEAELGLKLFNRERQRLVITEAGRAYLVVVRDAFDRIGDGTERLLQRQRGGSFDFWRSRRVLDSFNERALSLIADVGLSDVTRVTAVDLPYGRKRALEIATTLALDPEMLLLDEPTAGMGPEERWRMIDKVRELWETQKITVVFIEHDMDIVFKIAPKIVVLCYGRILATGTPDEIRNNSAVIDAYLGTEHAGAAA